MVNFLKQRVLGWPWWVRLLVALVVASALALSWPMMKRAGDIGLSHISRANAPETLGVSKTVSPTSHSPKPKPTSTPKKTPTPTPKPTSTPTPTPMPPSGGGGGGTQAYHCASAPHVCGFPDATNTGPVGCSSYTVMSGNIEINDDNAVINCVRMTGSFDVYANNVTIENSIIVTRNWWGVNQRVGYQGLKVLHNTITGDIGHGLDNGGEDYGFSNSGNNIEAGWNNISEFGAPISTSNGNIHDNYNHDNQPFIPWCGSDAHDNPIVCSYYVHSDPFISSGNDTTGLILRHNTLFDPETTEMGASASIGLFADDGPVSNTTVDNNLVAGGAYCIYPGGGSTSRNIVITNNHFSTIYWANCGVYGPDATSYWHTGGGNVWSGNVWDDGPNAGQTVNP